MTPIVPRLVATPEDLADFLRAVELAPRLLHRGVQLAEVVAPEPTPARPGAPEHPSTPCLIWIRSVASRGYAQLSVAHSTPRQLHLFIYETIFGPVPSGKVLGHLCERRACVRSDHIRPIDHIENVREGRRQSFPAWLLSLAPEMNCKRCESPMVPSIHRFPSANKKPRWEWTCRTCHAEWYRNRRRGIRLPRTSMSKTMSKNHLDMFVEWSTGNN